MTKKSGVKKIIVFGSLGKKNNCISHYLANLDIITHMSIVFNSLRYIFMNIIS